MLSSFENLGIKTKLVIAFLVVAAFAGLLGVVSVVNIQKMKKADTFMYQEVRCRWPVCGISPRAFLLKGSDPCPDRATDR